MDLSQINRTSFAVINCAIKIHRALGPGLLESAYEECLYYEMNGAGLFIERQLPLPLTYHDTRMEIGYRVDFRVEKHLIVEIKSCESISDVHIAQVLTYMKLSSCKVGLILNFNVLILKDGIRRLIL